MRRIRDQHQVREILLKVGPNEAGEVEVAEEVAVDDEEGLIAEQGKRQGNSAGGFERLGFARVADFDARTAAGAPRPLGPWAEVRGGGYDLPDGPPRERPGRP